ncbi:hypothetical protein FH972_024141 [Carpinus fangiana]|uniref:Aquaporin n=1 Tax=Carpinus fangiana TaxID=176857 RepID=A0A5N6KZN8_9ROSI|nr:hypothetical protein FH972_024141 [Carpinus fangiana]
MSIHAMRRLGIVDSGGVHGRHFAFSNHTMADTAMHQISGMKMNMNTPANGLNVPGMKYQRKKPYLHFVPVAFRGTIVTWIGEFVGTFLFLFFAFAGTEVANIAVARDSGPDARPNPASLLYISLCFGISLMVNVWAFFRITGGMFNPAVSLGLAMVGGITWKRMLVAWSAQIVGSIAAAALVSGLFPGSLGVNTTLSSGTSVVRGLFIEVFLTAELVFVIFMLAVEKNKATFIAPVGIGLALLIAELAGVAFTGGSLNPARSFGPAVVTPHFPGYHWIYWVGPFLGTLVAVLFYKIVRGLEYEVDNPNAADLVRREASDAEQSHMDPPGTATLLVPDQVGRMV